MKVKATQTGFMFDRRYYEGDEFELKDKVIVRKDVETLITAKQQFSEKWMIDVDGALDAPEKTVTKKTTKKKASKKSEEPEAEVQTETDGSTGDDEVI